MPAEWCGSVHCPVAQPSGRVIFGLLSIVLHCSDFEVSELGCRDLAGPSLNLLALSGEVHDACCFDTTRCTPVRCLRDARDASSCGSQFCQHREECSAGGDGDPGGTGDDAE